MNGDNYNKLLEKYYNGLSSVEEERWLKNNRQLLQEPLPLLESDKEDPVMDWSFQEFLAQVNQQQQKPVQASLLTMRWTKYAAAILVTAMLSIALYYSMHKKLLPKNETAFNLPPAVEAKRQLNSDSVAVKSKVQVTRKAFTKHKAVTNKKQPISAEQPAIQQKNDDFFVMVDGRRITNEDEALSVLQHSVTRLSGNMQETMSGLNNFPKLDVKFK